MTRRLSIFVDEIRSWRQGWMNYLRKHIRSVSVWFETQKNGIVDILMARRGMYQRPFMHFSLGILFTIGVLSAPILADSYPGANIPKDLATFAPPSSQIQSLDFSSFGVQTQVSQKPRDQIIDHTVAQGETLSSIANKYDISVDTVRWANDLKSDSLSVGQTLQIPPVTGIVHKVREGETIYTIAKKYKTDAQNIVNFPFNDFVDEETFGLNVGQSLIVPNGVMPEAPPVIVQRPVQMAPASGMPSGGGSGQFAWPTNGIITQYPIWYHMALDIANPGAPPVTAAGNGVVSLVEFLTYGYGRHIIIDHGNGFQTLYGHLQEIYVKPGDQVTQGQIIGKMGSTGHSTGTHLHFEVRKGGVTQNPLGYLK